MSKPDKNKSLYVAKKAIGKKLKELDEQERALIQRAKQLDQRQKGKPVTPGIIKKIGKQ